MNHNETIKTLLKNRGVFQDLLGGTEKEQYLWRPDPDAWNLLEIICHLHDEEREDFRSRLRHTLKTPDLPLPEINPTEWVNERKYSACNFDETLEKFLQERIQSIEWLSELKSPPWANSYLHPKIGPLSAEMFLANWLAHDYLHIRQITRIKFQYLKQNANVDLAYAGERK
jgi:hypothetical protein